MEKISFENSINVTVVHEQKVAVQEILDYEFRDAPAQKLVQVKITNPHLGMLTLWQGDDYDQIGDWTEEQAIDRIKEILTIKST